MVFVVPFLILFNLILKNEYFKNKSVQWFCTLIIRSMLLSPEVIYVNRIKTNIFPVIFVANHVSIFDIFLSGSLLPGFPRGYEVANHFRKPFYGWFISFFGQIPLDPKNKASVMRSILKGEYILKKKERNLFFMPEGTRTRTGVLGKFNNGAFLLSKSSGIPIVPVIFKGLFDRNNANSFLINPGKVSVIIGEPVFPEDFSNKEDMCGFVYKYIENKLEE